MAGISVALRKLFQMRQGKSGYIQVCNKGSRQSKHQRSGIKQFSILCMGRWKPLGSPKSFLSYAPELSGANPVSLFILLLSLPQLLSNHLGVVAACAGSQFGELSLTLEIADGCDISYLLVAGDIFISQSEYIK